jgi:hypothetical protein
MRVLSRGTDYTNGYTRKISKIYQRGLKLYYAMNTVDSSQFTNLINYAMEKVFREKEHQL